MTSRERPQSTLSKLLGVFDHPFVNVGFLVWGLFIALVWATVRDDEYLIAKGAEIVALALGGFLIQREMRPFFWGMVATGIALPIAFYTTSPLFFSGFVPIFSSDFVEMVVLGLLCAIPFLWIGIWGLRRKVPDDEQTKPDPGWVKWIGQIFKCTLALMVFSFYLASPLLIILGILVFLGGMIALATVRLRLTRRNIGSLLLMIGVGIIVVSILLIPLGIAHVDGEEAALAIVPAAFLILIGLALRALRPKA